MTFGPIMVSPNIRSDQLAKPPTLDDKINVFDDRVRGWQLDIANLVINGRSPKVQAIPHSAFAALSIVLSYFEMIAKHREGYTGHAESGHFFRRGLRWLLEELPEVEPHPDQHTEALLILFYRQLRCGMYHAAITGHQVVLSGDINAAITYDLTNRFLVVNPHFLIPLMSEHFQRYVGRLRDPANVDLRTRFEACFDAQH